MKRMTFKSIIDGALMAMILSAPLHADDLQSLCNSLQNQTISTAPSSSGGASSTAGSAKQKTPQKTHHAAASVSAGQSQNVILAPKDKFPAQVSGMYVAGNFMPKFLEADGLVLVPAEDYLNPFARQFIVANVNTGVSGGQIVPVNNPHIIQVSPNRPLIIVSRGIIPGSYIVNSQ